MFPYYITRPEDIIYRLPAGVDQTAKLIPKDADIVTGGINRKMVSVSLEPYLSQNIKVQCRVDQNLVPLAPTVQWSETQDLKQHESAPASNEVDGNLHLGSAPPQGELDVPDLEPENLLTPPLVASDIPTEPLMTTIRPAAENPKPRKPARWTTARTEPPKTRSKAAGRKND